ncbi:MAG: FAD-dependent oxidoreductase [Candidatus Polarisedimenticolaceae bacterium]|nr:FAD-dependent oxidoreductase [Candidatus Polarisedimenticolaceae bacterium]
MSDSRHELVVVGGGISGLGLAHMAAKKGLKPLVIEANDRVGGCIHSHHFTAPEGEFWAELGAHTCFNSYGHLLAMLEDLNLLDDLLPKQKLSYQLLTAQGLGKITSQLSFVELLISLPKLFSLKKEQCTAEEFYGGIVGKKNFKQVLGPALDAVICQSAAAFPANSLFIKKPRRKEIMRSFTAEGGLEQFVRAIADQPGIEVRTRVAVTAIEKLTDGYQLQLDDGTQLVAEKLALAIAPDLAARLLQPVLPAVTELLQEIEMAEIESCSVLIEKQYLKLAPMAGIIAVDDDFYSAVARDPVPDNNYRAFTFHFRPGRLDHVGKLVRISEILGLNGPTEIESVANLDNRLPSLRMGHEKRIAALDALLVDQPLALIGNWFTGVSIEDSLCRTASEFDRLVV